MALKRSALRSAPSAQEPLRRRGEQRGRQQLGRRRREAGEQQRREQHLALQDRALAPVGHLGAHDRGARAALAQHVQAARGKEHERVLAERGGAGMAREHHLRGELQDRPDEESDVAPAQRRHHGVRAGRGRVEIQQGGARRVLSAGP